jgi:hypothetical protein
VCAGSALLLGGCASLINGTHQTVPISTNVPGATVRVNGMDYIAPVDASLQRNQNYQIVASKPGYETATREVTSSFSAITFLDTVFWIPWVIDLVDGAAYKLEPESVELQLVPSSAPQVGAR